MPISLHKQATTTPRIQAGTDPARMVAERDGISEQTVGTWRGRDGVHDRSHTPHRLQTTLTPRRRRRWRALRKTLLLPLDELLAVVREVLNPHVSRSAHRIRRIAGSLVPAGRRSRLQLKALHGSPGIHQGVIDREMLVREPWRHLVMRQDGGHDPTGHLRRQQPVAVLAEHRGDPDRIIDPEAHEPAEEQVGIRLLHELRPGPDRVEGLQQAGWDRPLRRDGGVALTRVEPVELGVQRAQRIVDDGPDPSKRMSRRNSMFEIGVAERRARHLVRSPTNVSPVECWTYGGSTKRATTASSESPSARRPVADQFLAVPASRGKPRPTRGRPSPGQ
ncbi:hypothetical protein EV657_1437 [Rhodovulum visakhapatnamense]|uniref:Uncharacterized protein n=1 Tax=Rhodovulum visakhapatnamense TaxID=364297 RepID=A0A4R8FC50_9RHOB|nr:hypothetical protein EV657_1437 [Rhodovulum visakhapatnamense]